MTKLHRWSFAATFTVAFFMAAPVLAQWQVPDHSVPVGRGSGTGFKSVGPCATGYFIGGNGAAADPSCQGFIAAGAGAVTLTPQEKSRQIVNLADYGVVTGVAADQSGKIQQAINDWGTGSTGAILNTPCPGVIRIDNTIALSQQNGVTIKGCGRTDYGLSPTTFSWYGSAGATMFQVVSVAGPTAGVGIIDAALDGRGIAGRGLTLRSVSGSKFDVLVLDTTVNGVDIDLAVGGTGTQNNSFDFSIYQTAVASVSAVGLEIGPGQSMGGNTNQNVFNTLNILIQNGNAFNCYNADSNLFVSTNINYYFGSGSGGGVEMFAPNSPQTADQVCGNNHFVNLLSIPGVHAYAGTASNSTNNTIDFLQLDSGGSPVTVDTGATLWWNTSEGTKYVAKQVVGAPTSALLSSGLSIVHTGVNQNLVVGPPFNIGSGVKIQSINDAGNSNQPIEFIGSEYFFSNAGAVVFQNGSSGSTTISVPSTGTPTLQLPNTSGTFAVGASSPLVLNTTTGTLTCPTCLTGTGGAITANVTTTSGFTAGQVAYSDGSKIQAAGVTGSLGSVVLSTAPTISSPNISGTIAAPITVASGATQFPATYTANPSTHATSRRASFVADQWAMMQDTGGNGTKDWGLYNNGFGAFALQFSTTNSPTFPALGSGVAHLSAGGAMTSSPVVSADMNITTTSCTNQFITAISASGVGTCSTVAAANIASGALANGMTATTQTAADNSTKIATTAYVDAAAPPGAWTTYSPSATCNGAAIDGTNGSAITYAKYVQFGKTVSFSLKLTCRNNSGTGGIQYNLPTVPAGSSAAVGRSSTTGEMLVGQTDSGAQTVNLSSYNNVLSFAQGYIFTINGTYESQ